MGSGNNNTSGCRGQTGLRPKRVEPRCQSAERPRSGPGNVSKGTESGRGLRGNGAWARQPVARKSARARSGDRGAEGRDRVGGWCGAECAGRGATAELPIRVGSRHPIPEHHHGSRLFGAARLLPGPAWPLEPPRVRPAAPCQLLKYNSRQQKSAPGRERWRQPRCDTWVTALKPADSALLGQSR